ncbi:MAG: phytanoyl-CoA dioxygenase family protein [Verrucomicrobiales bacterium]
MDVLADRRSVLCGEGFTVVRGFFSREEIAEVRAGQERFYQGEWETEPAFAWPKPRRVSRARSRKHPYASFFIKSLGRLLRDGRLARLVAGETGMAGVRFWHDQLLYEEPARREKSAQWHTERSRWMTCETGMMATAWIPLVDFSEEMGPITMVAGSQNEGELLIPPEWEPECGRRRAMSLRAGDLVIFDWHMVHGNPPNVSNLTRRAVAAHFCEDEIRYRPCGRFSHVNERLVRRIGGQPDFQDERVCPLLLEA